MLDTLPSDHARVLHPYATWQVLRRFPHKARRGLLTEHGAPNSGALVRTAAHFMNWLSEHDKTLTTARQADLDSYLVAHPGRLRYLVGFLTWAHERQLTGDLQAPTQKRSNPEVTLADDDRWGMVHHLLHNDSLSPDARVAGLFVLLYGQPLTRICRMTPEQVTITDDHVTVRFGEDPIALPHPLNTLVAALFDRRGRSAYASHPNGWLFPGGHPGRHRSTGSLLTQLARAGVTIRPARNAALVQLAAEIPTPVLADLLGLAPNTAVIWAALASRDWAAYTAQRAHPLEE